MAALPPLIVLAGPETTLHPLSVAGVLAEVAVAFYLIFTELTTPTMVGRRRRRGVEGGESTKLEGVGLRLLVMDIIHKGRCR